VYRNRRNLEGRLNRLEAHTGTDPAEEERRERVARALDWLLLLRLQGRPRRAPLSDIVPRNQEEREKPSCTHGDRAAS
jgi:hypothetical protein